MELELSLTLPESSHQAVHAWLAQQPHTTFTRSTRLLNVYFDTPNLALKQQKAALRLRFDVEKQCWLQTLKTSGQIIDGVHARQEWESELSLASQSAQNLPNIDLSLFDASAQAYLQAYITELQPIFRTDFNRDIYDYRDAGNHFEWAFDDGAVVLLSDARQTPIHELEIEYKSGDLAILRTLAAQAQEALHAKAQNISKAARGYALLAT